MTAEYLNIAAIQTSLFWEDKEANLHMFTEKIRVWDEETDVMVLPEMFTTGFSMDPSSLAEEPEGVTLDWMRQTASKRNFSITGSFIVKENGRYFNRLHWVNPDGSYQTYDKRHLFRMAGEDQHYAAGDKKLIVECKGWKIMPLVCYDLRFPVWSRNRWIAQGGELKADYDVAIYVANWPERRAHPWKTLLMARAMENLSYVVGVNRTGNDGNNIYHCGDSAIHNFRGDVITSALIATEEIISARLSMKELVDFRNAFPAGRDADDFTIR